MSGIGSPVWPRRQLVRMRDAEETRAFLQTQDFRLEISAREARHTDTVIKGVSLPGMYLGYLQYGAAAEIRANAARDEHRILPPLRGRLDAVSGRDEVSCGPGRAIITSPSLSKLVRSERDSFWLNIFLRGPALRRHLAGLLGEPARAPLEFAPVIDLGGGCGHGLVGYALSAMADLDRDPPLMSPITIGLFEQFLMVGLLLGHPHNYSHALNRAQRWIAPRDVRRAIDFIEANLDEPIVLADVVAASGIAGRTLSQHFQRFHGTTPMRYLHRARLAKVRDALQGAEPEESVTSIALNWGFAHMGRFSVEYRKAYGETPSQTLGKHRPSRGF